MEHNIYWYFDLSTCKSWWPILFFSVQVYIRVQERRTGLRALRFAKRQGRHWAWDFWWEPSLFAGFLSLSGCHLWLSWSGTSLTHGLLATVVSAFVWQIFKLFRDPWILDSFRDIYKRDTNTLRSDILGSLQEPKCQKADNINHINSFLLETTNAPSALLLYSVDWIFKLCHKSSYICISSPGQFKNIFFITGFGLFTGF